MAAIRGTHVMSTTAPENTPTKILLQTPSVNDKPHPRTKRTLACFSLEGQVAVVTGGARGLGLTIAQALATSGANVALVDLDKQGAEIQAEALMHQLRCDDPTAEIPPKATAHFADVSAVESVEAAVNEIVALHGKIDILVTSAGFVENFDAINYPVDRMRRLWSVNVDGTYLFAVAVARHLFARRARGSMIFVASMSGNIVNVPQPQTPYNASKAAVKHMAASLAVEWANAGIRVNSLSPGYMVTDLLRAILDKDPALEEKWTSLTPMGRLGVPQDLLGAVVFLASDASLYMTGADLRLDGGYTAI